MSLMPPTCRHRGLKCGADRWACHSPKLVIPGGLVSARDCSEVCPFVDHSPGADPIVDERRSERDGERIVVSPGGSEDVAIGVLTAPRAIPTLERTLCELRRAGFSQAIRVFAEPGAFVPRLPGVIAVPAASTLGAWKNWERAARTLLEDGNHSHILICQDDIALAECGHLALKHAIRTLPAGDWGYASLYTPIHHLATLEAGSGEGWRAIDLSDRDYWGALALGFTRESLRAVLSDNAVRGYRRDRGIDVIVSKVLRASGRRLYYHVPSLADHTGKGISSLGHAPLPGSLAAGFSHEYARYVLEATPDRRSRPRSSVVDPAPERMAANIEVKRRDVSVVIATYNCAGYLPDCIRSLMSQTVPCEIVVVDDGSRDDTRDVLRSFEGAIRILQHDQNQGARAARSTGLRSTRSEWVVLADADAIYQPDYLESLLAAADEHASVVYCSWQRQVPDATESTIVRARPFDAEALWWNNWISMSSLIRRSDIPESLGNSDDLDDWSLWLELASRGHQFRAVDRILFHALERPEGKTAGLRRDPQRYRREVARFRRTYARLIGLEGRITVVIPARDCLDLTEQCLRHLADYSGLPLEVVYVDNGSLPEVPARVAALAESLDLALATIRNSSNRKFTRAVNQGLKFAEGRHVLCLNNDCFIGPDCLERLYWHLTRSAGRVAVVGPLTGDNEGQSLRRPRRRAQAGISADRDVDYNDPLAGAQAVHGPFRSHPGEMVAFFCALLDREALKDCGPLDEQTLEFEAGLGADDEWCLRARRRGWTVLVALDAYAVHLGHQSFQRLQIDRDLLQGQARATFHDLVASDRPPASDHAGPARNPPAIRG